MINSKSILFLRSLSANEWDLFQSYLPMLIYSKYKDIIPFFNHIKKFYPEFSHPDLEKETCYKKLFPQEKYDDKKMRYYLSYLKESIEKFLVIHSIQNDTLLYKRQLESELLKRNLLINFKQENKEVDELLKTNKTRDSDYFYNTFYNELLKLNYISISQNRDEKNNIENVMIQLDKFYLSKKLQIASEVINIKNILSTEYNTFMLDEIISYLQNHEYTAEPAIQVYLLIIKTLQEPENESYYTELEILLQHNIQKFTLKELYEIYQYLQNYCIKKINIGDVSYQNKLFDNYKIQIDNNIIIYSGNISQWDYKNIVTIALRLKEIDWAEQFILRYKNYLTIQHKENAYSYNYANVLFRKGDYDASLKMLQHVNMTDVYYKLDARSMLLKTYYELNEYETLKYHAQAFKKFLHRDKIISPYQKEIYLNMITYIMKLHKAKGIKSKIKKIKHDIKQANRTADINWLKDAAEKL